MDAQRPPGLSDPGLSSAGMSCSGCEPPRAVRGVRKGVTGRGFGRHLDRRLRARLWPRGRSRPSGAPTADLRVCLASITRVYVRCACACQVVIRPMMNIALTYDHRLIDGREVRPGRPDWVDVAQRASTGRCGFKAQPHGGSGTDRSLLGSSRPSRDGSMRAEPHLDSGLCSGTDRACSRTCGLLPSAYRLLTAVSCRLGLCLQAVTFLRHIKDVVEDPRRLLLDI